MMMAAFKGAVPILKPSCASQSSRQHNFSGQIYCCQPRFDFSDSGSKHFLHLSLHKKLECGFGLWAQSQGTTADVDKDSKAGISSSSEDEETQIAHATGFHKDMNFLPRPLSALHSSSSPDGRQVRIAYQGAPGSFSEDAALKAYPMCETVPCDKFATAIKAVELWLVDKAILPIENSIAGSIHRNYDLLLSHRLHIVGEVPLVMNHCLLGIRGVRKEELKFVLSHPQALDSCKATLSKLGVSRIGVEDTAGAAQLVASESMRETGAIASARAAEIYGLDVIAKNIQDDSDNITRFLILAREPIIPKNDRPYKTSIVVSLVEGPGVLFKALGAFALRGIKLCKVESRPHRNRPLRIVDDSNCGSAKYFDYLFFIDFEASMAEPRAQNALANLQELARFLRVLGCYPLDTGAL